ncbi:hypothetical protein QLX08_007395 [Tetragonisca angustula]|uniref:Uncharacterized protein n=1 Tax=Tetragonisca angustula TaxID=166442 RepID=A0AAW0ZSK4_9HYME
MRLDDQTQRVNSSSEHTLLQSVMEVHVSIIVRVNGQKKNCKEEIYPIFYKSQTIQQQLHYQQQLHAIIHISLLNEGQFSSKPAISTSSTSSATGVQIENRRNARRRKAAGGFRLRGFEVRWRVVVNFLDEA